jgi:hypothetical protein
MIPTIVSSLGAVPKSNGDIRLIHDASQPVGNSLNSYTSDTNCSYMDMRHDTYNIIYTLHDFTYRLA